MYFNYGLAFLDVHLLNKNVGFLLQFITYIYMNRASFFLKLVVNYGPDSTPIKMSGLPYGTSIEHYVLTALMKGCHLWEVG